MKLWMPNRLRSLRVVATMHRNVAGGDSDSRDLTAILRRVIADLEGLNHETEQDFLRIGRKLGEFVQEAKGISSMLTELAEGITGEQGLRASEALQGFREVVRVLVEPIGFLGLSASGAIVDG